MYSQPKVPVQLQCFIFFVNWKMGLAAGWAFIKRVYLKEYILQDRNSATELLHWNIFILFYIRNLYLYAEKFKSVSSIGVEKERKAWLQHLEDMKKIFAEWMFL